ncbi:MAG: alpha/beta hydrolase [Bacteroidota bacterium]
MHHTVLLPLLVFLIFSSCSNEPHYHFVKIRGKQQHVLTWGKGEPVVVFLSGGGSGLKDFKPVQQVICKTTKTISYDKFGLGKSELIDTPRTLENITEELQELLEKEESIDMPLILVGHSMGGYVARYYLHRYPENVIGIILIDPGSEFLHEEYRKTRTEKELQEEDSLLSAQIKRIPKGFQMEVNAYNQHDSLLQTFAMETTIPITLLESNSIDENDPSEKKLIEIQKRLYREFQKKVPQTKIISTSKSGHFIQLDEPNLVIGAIHEMLVKVQ